MENCVRVDDKGLKCISKGREGEGKIKLDEVKGRGKTRKLR